MFCKPPCMGHNPPSVTIREEFRKSLQYKNTPDRCRGCYRQPRNASQSFVRRDEIKCNLFFAPACTKQKIQIGLQVWNLFTIGEQIMRAAELQAHRICGGISVERLCRVFPQTKTPPTDVGGVGDPWIIRWCSYRSSPGCRQWECPCRRSRRSGRTESRSGRSGGGEWYLRIPSDRTGRRPFR